MRKVSDRAGNATGMGIPEAFRTDCNRSGASSMGGMGRSTNIQRLCGSLASRPAASSMTTAAGHAESSNSGCCQPHG